jgi:hypothetical protein
MHKSKQEITECCTGEWQNILMEEEKNFGKEGSKILDRRMAHYWTGRQ